MSPGMNESSLFQRTLFAQFMQLVLENAPSPPPPLPVNLYPALSFLSRLLSIFLLPPPFFFTFSPLSRYDRTAGDYGGFEGEGIRGREPRTVNCRAKNNSRLRDCFAGIKSVEIKSRRNVI